MSDEKRTRPKGINKASDKKRFIKLNMDVTKINKDWLHVGKDGAVYLNCTLHLMPDGTVDKYENLGFITQDVPKSVYENDKEAKGEILGNGSELDFKSPRLQPGEETGQLLSTGDADDLPF